MYHKIDNELEDSRRQLKAQTLFCMRIRIKDDWKEGGVDHQVKKITQEKIAVKEETFIGKYDSWN